MEKDFCRRVESVRGLIQGLAFCKEVSSGGSKACQYQEDLMEENAFCGGESKAVYLQLPLKDIVTSQLECQDRLKVQCDRDNRLRA